MDDLRMHNYKKISKEVEIVLKQLGLLNSELAIVGYFLLNKNIDFLKKEIELDNRVISIIEEAEKLLSIED